MTPLPTLWLALACAATDGAERTPDPDTDTTPEPADTATPDTGAPDTPPAPWSAAVEVCGGGDEDNDGLVDEDCAPSLWAGLFVPGASGDYASDGLIATLEADVGGAIPVQQTYRSTSEAGANNAVTDLLTFWSHGVVVHLNVEPLDYTSAQYESGGADSALDADLATMAEAIASSLATDPSGRLLLTFGAEMNGAWTDWGCLDPSDYIALHDRFRAHVDDALDGHGVDRRRVRWVFGPDSRGSGSCADAADYYPGDVDLLGMSAYRSDTDSLATTVVEPATSLMDALGWPDAWRRDRFVILQTASRDDDRAGFIDAVYGELQDEAAFLGVIWFNSTDDWAVIDTSGPRAGYDAFVAALAALPTHDPQLEGTFDPYFWDVGRDHPRYPELQALRAAGVTSGCAAAPPRYCPDDALERGDAATLMRRAFGVTDHAALTELSSVDPAAAITRVALADALAQLAGVTPRDEVPYTDLSGVDAEVAARIAALAWASDIDGCGDGVFCPDDAADRATGGAWIVRVADLPPAPPP